MLVALADIMGADHARGWLAPLAEQSPADVTAAALAHRKLLTDALASKDASVRAAALPVHALLPALGSLATIRELASSDPDPIARASALLALARLGEVDAESRSIFEQAAKSDVGLIRGAATIALLRIDRKRTLGDSAEGIEAWLSASERLPWFGGLRTIEGLQFLPPPAYGLARLAQNRKDALLDFVLQLGRRTQNGNVIECGGQIVLQAGGFLRFEEANKYLPFVALPDELSSDEKKLASALAETPLLPNAGYGLPAAGACRKRWIGAAPPSALEKTVNFEMKKKKQKQPFWRAWRMLDDNNIYGEPIPPPIEGQVSGLDRWRAIIDFGVRAYGHRVIRLDAESVEGELARVAKEPRLFEAIAEAADDLAARLEVADRANGSDDLTFGASCLLMLPLVRAKKKIEPRWDRLIFVDDEPLARELLLALPEERRQARVLSRATDDALGWDALPTLLELFELVPCEPMARWIARTMTNAEAVERLGDFDKLEPARKRIRELAKQFPKLAPLLSAKK
jgi:hypothetical protein